MSDKSDISHARIIEMLEVSQRFSPGLSKKFRLDHESGKLAGTFFIADEKHRGELESVLEDFGDVLRESHTHIYRRMPFDTVSKFISECRFEEVERVAVAEITEFLDEARESQGDDAAYAFAIWTDAEQGQWDYQICLESGFKEALDQAQARTRVYDSAEATERFKYYEYTSFGFYPGEEMRALLYNIQESGYKNFEMFGDQFDNDRHCFELMLDTVSRILNSSRGGIVKRLLTTEDFVLFPRLCDQDSITEFRAVRKTMKNAEIEASMGHLFSGLLT